MTQRKRCAKRISSLGEETNTIFTPSVTMATTRRLYDTNQHSSPAWTVSTRADSGNAIALQMAQDVHEVK